VKYLKKFIALLPVILFGLYLGAAQHDDGILEELTPVQQEQLVQLFEELVLATESVSQAMDEFTNHPEQESEMIERLLDASSEYRAVCLKFDSHPAANSRRSAMPDGTVESYEQKVESLLVPASKRMTTELLRRKESDDFKCDQAGYDRIRELFIAITTDPRAESSCFTQKCFWCYLRNYWKMN